MAMLMRRMLMLVAATLLASVSWLGVGVGVGTADPYDDDDGTVEVAPDVVAEEPPQQEVPDVDYPNDVDEPVQGGEPDTVDPGPEPSADDPGGEPSSAGSTADEPATSGSDDDTASQGTPGGGDERGAGDDDADATAPDNPSADLGDVTKAQDSTPVVADTRQVDETSVTEMRSTVETALSSSTSLQVTQWSSSWTRYDQYYQPLIANPFPVPIQLAYVYAGRPYVLTIPPLAQSVLSVPRPGVYSFTALVPNASGGVAGVSVGRFSGGGYVPRPGQPRPPKPPALVSYPNVLVRFDLAGVQYDPVVVKKVVDLGDDAETSTRKVLLDEETPAWGSWGQTDSGRREFTVTSTQSMPGLTPPSASPPPGYKLTVTSSSAPSSDTSVLAWVAVGLGVLAVLAVVLVIVLVKRRRGPVA
jgi:hypothetical protein